jgi:hypothetical protein
MFLKPSKTVVLVLGLLALLSCKPRQDNSAVLAETGSNDASLALGIDAVDVSFMLPPVDQEAIAAKMVIPASAAGQCGGNVKDCGSILAPDYYRMIAEGHGPIGKGALFPQGLPREQGVPRFFETKDIFTDFAGKQRFPTLSENQRLARSYKNMFISAIRFDPCAPAAHQLGDNFAFSPAKSCEPELRFVVQHWENGKPADQGFHIGVHLTQKETRQLLGDLVALRAFALKNGIKTNGAPIGLHPAFKSSNMEFKKAFFDRVRNIATKWSGDAVTKGIATFITLAREGGGVRWQWALTARIGKKPMDNNAGKDQDDPKVRHFGPVIVVGVANVVGSTLSPQGIPMATVDPETGEKITNASEAFMKRPKSVGFEVFKDENGVRVTDVNPDSAVAPSMAIISNTELFKNMSVNDLDSKVKSLDGTTVKISRSLHPPTANSPAEPTLAHLISESLAIENPLIAVIKPRKHAPNAGKTVALKECSTCHIQTPGRLRLLDAIKANPQQQAQIERKMATNYLNMAKLNGITAAPNPIAMEEYRASNYVVLNFAWHDSFGSKRVHPSVNMRTVNETAEVVRYIRENMIGKGSGSTSGQSESTNSEFSFLGCWKNGGASTDGRFDGGHDKVCFTDRGQSANPRFEVNFGHTSFSKPKQDFIIMFNLASSQPKCPGCARFDGPQNTGTLAPSQRFPGDFVLGIKIKNDSPDNEEWKFNLSRKDD